MASRSNIINAKEYIVQKTLQEFVQALVERHRDEIQRITLFGSHARGEARADSDVDVLVYTDLSEDKVKMLSPFWLEAVTLAHEIDHKYDYRVDISPTIVSREYATKWTPLLNNAQKESVLLWTKQ